MWYLLKHLTPASSEWAQLWTPIRFAGHTSNLSSDPTQFTLSSQMLPVPWPKRACPKAKAPTEHRKIIFDFLLLLGIRVFSKLDVHSTYLGDWIQVACRPLEHQQLPRHHHILFPTLLGCRIPHGPRWPHLHFVAWDLLVDRQLLSTTIMNINRT